MATRWEYTTIGLRIVQRRERGSSFFTHHTMRSNLDDISITELARAGREGWELVSVVHVGTSGPGGSDYAVGILKRPDEDDGKPRAAPQERSEPDQVEE